MREIIEGKKLFVILATAVLLMFLALGAVFFEEKIREKMAEPTPSLSAEELLKKQQLDELDRQRQQVSPQAFTAGQPKQQEEELDKMHQATVGASPAPDEQTQSERLDKIRASEND